MVVLCGDGDVLLVVMVMVVSHGTSSWSDGEIDVQQGTGAWCSIPTYLHTNYLPTHKPTYLLTYSLPGYLPTHKLPTANLSTYSLPIYLPTGSLPIYLDTTYIHTAYLHSKQKYTHNTHNTTYTQLYIGNIIAKISLLHPKQNYA